MAVRKLQGAEHTKIAGHHFYVLDPKSLPVSRMKGYMASLQEIDWGLTGEDLQAGLDLIKENLKKMDFVKAGAIVELMEAYREAATQPKVLWNLGNNFILVDDEPLKEYSTQHTELKRLLCETHKDVVTFFFIQSMRFVMNSSEQLTASDIEDYLKDPNLIKSEKAYLSRIGSNRYKVTSSGYTIRRLPFSMRVIRRLRRYLHFQKR